jgi:MFS superfamily sulfate permease-like transporter
VNRARAVEIRDRKALLAARALFDRAQMTVAAHDVRTAIAPLGTSGTRGPMATNAAALLVGLAAPVLGASRLGRWLRVVSWTLAAFRIARNWRSRY